MRNLVGIAISRAMLQTADLHFDFPESLVAQEARPRGQSRILKISRDRNDFHEVAWPQFMALFAEGDTLVLNDSQVLWARLMVDKESGKQGEIFFLRTLDSKTHWQVLAKALNMKVGRTLSLPGGLRAEVVKQDRTCEIVIDKPVDLKAYFEKYGHVPLPPYITGAREAAQGAGASVNYEAFDKQRYQNVWAKNWGSVAAPTAGLHFSGEHLDALKKRGVKIAYVTLHVGAGTFLPIATENLEDFQIHSEVINVGKETCEAILATQARGKKVWACGTTALRALETAVHASPTAATRLPLIAPFLGETKLFVTPGYRFLVVDALLTNFHQPQSSLLALAAAFATRAPATSKAEARQAIEKIKAAYRFAIEEKFRLFSYGDLTVMI